MKNANTEINNKKNVIKKRLEWIAGALIILESKNFEYLKALENHIPEIIVKKFREIDIYTITTPLGDFVTKDQEKLKEELKGAEKVLNSTFKTLDFINVNDLQRFYQLQYELASTLEILK